VGTSLLLAEAVLYYQEKEGRTLFQVLEEIYQKYGYYLDDQISLTFTGKEGKEKIAGIMAKLRQRSVDSLGGIPLEAIEDYQLGIGKKLAEPERTYELKLPKSNVLRFSFQGGGFVMARPSGTEPKIKFYFNLKGKEPADLEKTLAGVKKDLLELVNA